MTTENAGHADGRPACPACGSHDLIVTYMVTCTQRPLVWRQDADRPLVWHVEDYDTAEMEYDAGLLALALGCANCDVTFPPLADDRDAFWIRPGGREPVGRLARPSGDGV